MPGQAKRLDLNEIAHQPGTRVSVQVDSPDHPGEVRSRIRRLEADARFDRIKDLVVLIAVLLAVAVVMTFCLWTASRQGSSAEDRKWATALLTSNASAGLGYLSGRAGKGARES